MQGRESGSSGFDLPDRVLQVLPSDPFEQLDVARKITSIALSTRVSMLESESSVLRSKISEKDEIVADLRFQIESLNDSLSETIDKLARADEEKESLEKENASLSNTVKKLRGDVAKEDTDAITSGGRRYPYRSSRNEDVSSLPSSRYSSVQSQTSEVGNSLAEDHDFDGIRPRIAPGLLLALQLSTPRLTPHNSSPSLSASISPKRTSRPVSPRRHSMSFSTSRNVFEDRSSVCSSAPSISSDKGQARIDGKELFRQVRTRLSYDQFAAFLSNVKDLNSHKQTKEEMLKKVKEIFGHDHKDLYTVFEGLVARSLH
ncbi:hypothetical protein SDJN02_10124 [Cucurbita argyrosperma subsp. argyrosperma]|nr:hypothetical protein SDJN02_10124 [Cucurbita argyrosperma subsp. argyrosperma]